MSYREIPEDKILKFPATPGFKGWKDHFTEDSITHPAKMNLNLLRWILKTYTKPGEIVLDPMAGTGSTIVLASLLGRHGIAVEYESRFCDMIRENIKRTSRQSTLTPKGRMTCIQGDARELSKLLIESDAIITSPPYSGRTEHRLGYDYQKRDEERGYKSYKGHRESYSADPNNISNLPHGDIETIITSPPYSSSNIGGDEDVKRIERMKKAIERGDKITNRNLLWLKSRMKGAKQGTQLDRERGYSGGPDNIANLPHGDIDSIITSPPFGPSTKGGGIFKEGYKAPGEDEVSDPGLPERHSRPLSDDPRNIDNLKYGEVDVVVSSPPYGGSVPAYDEKWLEEHWDDESDSPKHKTMRFGRSMRGYPKKVDTVVTSPPYSLTREGSDRIATGIDVKTGKSLWSKTGSEFSEGNIQKLPHGDVDAVVTSPPYEGSYLGGEDQEERKKRLIESGHDIKDFFGGKARGATLKHYDEVDAVVSSPPYGNRLADDVVQDGDEDRISYRQAMDSIVTSPPYEESLTGGGQVEKEGFVQGHIRDKLLFKDGYSTNQDNIGNLKSESYLEAMFQVYRECHKVLKSDGIMILVTKNFIRDKAIVRLDEDTIKLCEAAGFRLSDRWYFKLPTRSFWRILYRRKYPDVPEVAYEDVLVFAKGVDILDKKVREVNGI